jgi:hypothetical protein
MNPFKGLTLSRQSGWKLAAIFGFSVLLVLGLLLAQAHTASAASGATITSDKADYQPGATVTLTGAGWDSGEAVHIFVNDTVGNTWSLSSNPDPAADGNGSFTYSFSLPNSFVSSYTVTATGPTSGTATTTFTDSNCPASGTGNPQTDNDVGASFTTSGSTATYTFSSFVNKTSSGGVPGLIEYCVYTTPPPGSVTPVVHGANGTAWSFSLGSDRFAFERPGGDPSNIPLDGTTGITMGSATWSGSIPSQTILLHINDATVCNNLYGGNPGTCFVLPGSPQQQAQDLTVSKTATPSFTRTFTWGITKSVDQTKVIDSSGSATFNYTVSVTHDSGTDSGWQVTGKITVTNPNGSDVTGVNVTDADTNGGACTVSGGSGVTVPAGKSVDLDYTCTYSSAPSPSSGTNTATATWPDIGSPHTSATGIATFDFSKVSPTLVDDSVSVTDSLGGTLGTVSSTDPSPTTFTYKNTVTGTGGTCVTQDNKATFTTNTTGTTGSDSKSVQLCTPVDLKVAKDATPSFTRTYNWSIAKSVDKTLLDPGGTATYTVTVTETGFTDSGWQVNGTITITNPNDFESITLTGVTDAVDNGGSCSITSGSTTATIAASGNVTLSYSCTYSSAPTSSSGTNTATANWDKAAASTPGGSAQGTKTFAFTTPTTTVNKTITVTDTIGGTLGNATATDSTPFTSQTFTYTHKFTPPASGCQTVNNTATIKETGQTASASVKNCNTGALTMGFWQNQNGQKIISAANQTALGAWLGQYHPFSNAPSSGLATYVYNIIKAANCSGTTCNSMLRAQMLATALDVYFSDPALGGNKINAPAPIGGVTIDLTNICKMIDGSGGTATCSGTFEDVRSAFGGATSMKVSDMLLYQNTSDPLADAGANWYNQVKATQVLAKDAFDAINNQVAFAP